jgi:hypothetical protein
MPPPSPPLPPPKKERSPWFWVAIAVAGLVILGCLGTCVVLSILPSSTPTPTLTPTPAFTATFTPTPPPTPTFTPEPTPTPKVEVGMLLYEEDFVEPGDEWELSEGDDVVYKVEGGTYSIDVRKERWKAWNTIGEEYADFVLDFDAALVEGNKFNAYGILFRYQSKDNHYELDINGNGSYTFGKEVDDEWSDIVDWTSSAAIKRTGLVNHVRLVGYGDTYTLYVNDQFVYEFTDSSFLTGEIAVVVTAYENPPARATFDNVKVWDVALR